MQSLSNFEDEQLDNNSLSVKSTQQFHTQRQTIGKKYFKPKPSF
jgi:hypothetical protein